MACALIAEIFAEYEGDRYGIPAAALRRTRERCGCPLCSHVFTLRQVRYVIELILRTEEVGAFVCSRPGCRCGSIGGVPSPEGFRLELARLNLLGKRAVDEWKKHESSERWHIEFALVAWVKQRLSPLQLGILRLANTPIGFRVEEWFVGLKALQPLNVPLGEADGIDAQGRALKCGARLKNGGSCTNGREAGEARCKRHHEEHSRPATWITPDGAELVRTSADGRSALVKGARALVRSPEEIGRDLPLLGLEPLNARQVQRQLAAIYETIRMLPHVGLLTERD